MARGSAAAASAGSAAAVAHLEALQHRLQAEADAEVKVGQDGYFKGVIFHRGVKTPAVEAVCKAFLKEVAAEPAGLRQLGLALLRQPLQEDKLAGMLCWRQCLLEAGLAEQWREELRALQQIYTDGHVFAWSTCDWICGRLLAPMIKLLLKSEPAQGEACASHVLAWCRHDNLWLRRSSVVAFVTMAKLPDDKVFPGFRASLLDALAATVRGEERFAQTGTGWVLRELGKGDSPCMLQFVGANLEHFSREGLRYALEHQPAAVRQPLMDRHKELVPMQRQQQQQQGEADASRPAAARRGRRRQDVKDAGLEQDADGEKQAAAAKRRRRKE